MYVRASAREVRQEETMNGAGSAEPDGAVEYGCGLCEESFCSRGQLAIHEILEHAPVDADPSGKHRHIGLVRGDGPYNFVGRYMP